MSKFFIDIHESQVKIRERMKAHTAEHHHNRTKCLSDAFSDSSPYIGVGKSWFTAVSMQNTTFILLL